MSEKRTKKPSEAISSNTGNEHATEPLDFDAELNTLAASPLYLGNKTVQEQDTEKLKQLQNILPFLVAEAKKECGEDTDIAHYEKTLIVEINKELERRNKELEKKLAEEKQKRKTAEQKLNQKNILYPLAQSHASNRLQKQMTMKLNNSTQIDLYGNGSLIGNDFKLFIKGYAELLNGVKQSAAMLLDGLMIKATEAGLQDTMVTLPLKEYMAMRDLKDEKEARKQIKEDLAAIERISFEYKGIGKNKGVWLKVHIAGGTTGQIKNGDIKFRFNQEFFDSFKAGAGNRYMFMYFPCEALQGNIRANPWKYWLARKISEHKRMNIGKPNENVISVKTLIDACPDFPTYEEVMEGDRAITRRIIEPFERDLYALSPSITWEYQGLEKTPDSYTEFNSANIVIHWEEYPALRKIEAGKRKRAAKQQASKKE